MLIKYGKGQITFFGGYINSRKTFKQALTRELYEETGIRASENSWDIFKIGILHNRILIFGLCKEIDLINLNFNSEETESIFLIDQEISLAFPLHENARNKCYA